MQFKQLVSALETCLANQNDTTISISPLFNEGVSSQVDGPQSSGFRWWTALKERQNWTADAHLIGKDVPS